jgi:hypothetical protein
MMPYSGQQTGTCKLGVNSKHAYSQLHLKCAILKLHTPGLNNIQPPHQPALRDIYHTSLHAYEPLVGS